MPPGGLPVISRVVRQPPADGNGNVYGNVVVRQPPAASRQPTDWRRRRSLALALAAGCAASGAGCVERLLQIRSDPPGAEVFVNGVRAGLTPLDHRFDFYGTFDISLRAKDHLSVHRLEKVNPPWYELMPLDFVTENLVPFKVRDRHRLRYALEPARPIEDEELDREVKEALERMEALEEKAGPPPEGATPP